MRSASGVTSTRALLWSTCSSDQVSDIYQDSSILIISDQAEDNLVLLIHMTDLQLGWGGALSGGGLPSLRGSWSSKVFKMRRS